VAVVVNPLTPINRGAPQGSNVWRKTPPQRGGGPRSGGGGYPLSLAPLTSSP